MGIPFCPSCGKEIAQDADLCPNCGYGTKPHQQLQTSGTGRASNTLGLARRIPIPWIAAGMVGVIALIMIASVTGVLYFGPPNQLTPPEQLSVKAGFTGSNPDQAIFLLNNTGSVDITIIQVRVQLSRTNLVFYAIQLANTIVPSGNATILIATFQGVDLGGNAMACTIYNYTLTSSRGNKFLASASYGCVYTRTEQLTITQTTLVAGTGTGAGQATFSLANSGTTDVTLTSFSVQGAGITGTQSGSIVTTGTTCTGGLVPKGSSCTLIVSFSPAMFTSGSRYDFVLTSSLGDRFPTSQIA